MAQEEAEYVKTPTAVKNKRYRFMSDIRDKFGGIVARWLNDGDEPNCLSRLVVRELLRSRPNFLEELQRAIGGLPAEGAPPL